MLVSPSHHIVSTRSLLVGVSISAAGGLLDIYLLSPELCVLAGVAVFPRLASNPWN